MKHTIGPWGIRDDNEDGVVSIVGGSQIVLARVRTATAEPGDENARLIAAAPDLLEALINLTHLVQPEGTFPDNLTVRGAIAEAHAAIAKATGENQ